MSAHTHTVLHHHHQQQCVSTRYPSNHIYTKSKCGGGARIQDEFHREFIYDNGTYLDVYSSKRQFHQFDRQASITRCAKANIAISVMVFNNIENIFATPWFMQFLLIHSKWRRWRARHIFFYLLYSCWRRRRYVFFGFVFYLWCANKKSKFGLQLNTKLL